MGFLAEHWSDILFGVTTIVTGASVLVKLTPTQKDDAALAKFMKFLEAISLNKK